MIILHNGGFGLFTEYFQILRRACLTPGDARSPPTAPKTIAVYILRLEKIMKMIAMKKRNFFPNQYLIADFKLNLVADNGTYFSHDACSK